MERGAFDGLLRPRQQKQQQQQRRQRNGEASFPSAAASRKSRDDAASFARSSGAQKLSSPTPSLTTAFVGLSEREFAFCNAVIAAIQPPASSGFPALRAAYEQQVLRYNATSAGASQPSRKGKEKQHAVNYHLAWETLVHLAKVRGTSWARRWDAVRLALGHEPQLLSSGSDVSRSDNDTSTGESGKSSGNELRVQDRAVAGSLRPRHARHAQLGAHSPSADALERRKRISRQDIDELRSRMEALSAEASSLAGSLRDDREAEALEDVTPSKPSIFVSRADDNRRERSPIRQLRFAPTRAGSNKDSKATTVESASDEDASGALAHVPAVSSSTARRFDEVVARAREERELRRQAQERTLEEAEEARMVSVYRHADNICAKVLLQKCLSWWWSSTQHQLEMREQAHHLRCSSLQLNAWKGWQSGRQRRESLVRTAIQVDVVRCKLRAWRVWVRRSDEARKARRKERRMELRGAFEVTRSRMEHRLVEHYFHLWRSTLLEHKATAFRHAHLLRNALLGWSELAERNRGFADKEQIISHQCGTRTLHRCWRHWASTKENHVTQQLADLFRDRRLLSAGMHQWIEVKSTHEVARKQAAHSDRWRARRLKLFALHAWLEKFLYVDTLQDKADAVVRERKSRLVSTTLQTWLLREREELLSRVRDERRLSTFMTLWLERKRKQVSALEAKERVLVINRQQSVVRLSFLSWKEITQQARAAQEMAGEREARKFQRQVFAKWRTASAEKELAWHRARATDTYMTQSRALALWTGRLRSKRADSLKRQKDRTALHSAFTLWRARTSERQRESLAVATLRSKHERRTRNHVLHSWMERVIERKSTFMEAAEAHDAKLVHVAWSRWLQACLRHEDLLNLCVSFVDVKHEEQLRRVFGLWMQAARAEKSRRERAAYFAAQRRMALVNDVFSRWYEQRIEATLRPLELEALVVRQSAAKQAVWKRWQDKTKSLPAIQLDHACLRSHVFYHWRELLPHARMRRKAVEHDRQDMLAKGFDHWLRVAKAKRAFRAASRFGGPSAVKLRAAHRRSSGGGYSGGAFGRSTASARRSRSSTPAFIENDVEHLMAAPEDARLPDVFDARDADVSSLRESDFGTAASPMPRMRRGGASQTQPTLAQLSAPHLQVSLQSAGEQRMQEAASATFDFSHEKTSPPPALRRWIMSVSQSLRPGPRGTGETTSEPGGAELDKGSREQRQLIKEHESDAAARPRTPSPAASRTQSEATVRVRNSPRKTSASVARAVAAAAASARNGQDVIPGESSATAQRPTITSTDTYRQSLDALRERRRRRSLSVGSPPCE